MINGVCDGMTISAGSQGVVHHWSRPEFDSSTESYLLAAGAPLWTEETFVPDPPFLITSREWAAYLVNVEVFGGHYTTTTY